MFSKLNIKKSLLPFLFLVVLVGCDKKSNPTPTPTPTPTPNLDPPGPPNKAKLTKEQLVGTWELDGIYLCDFSLSLLDSQSTKTSGTLKVSQEGDSIEFVIYNQGMGRDKYSTEIYTCENSTYLLSDDTIRIDNSKCERKGQNSFPAKVSDDGKRLFVYTDTYDEQGLGVFKENIKNDTTLNDEFKIIRQNELDLLDKHCKGSDVKYQAYGFRKKE